MKHPLPGPDRFRRGTARLRAFFFTSPAGRYDEIGPEQADRVLRRGVAQLKRTPVPQQGLHRILALLIGNGPAGGRLPERLPLPPTLSSGRWGAVLAGSLALGAVAGWWFTQARLDTGGEKPVPRILHVAKGEGFSTEVIRDQYGPPMRESRSPHAFSLGSARIVIDRVRILNVPDSRAGDNRWSDTGPHVFIDGRLFSPASGAGGRKMYELWPEILTRVEGWVPGSNLRSEAVSSLVMHQGDLALWAPPAGGAPFQFETLASKAVQKGAPMKVRFHLREAPVSALQQITFHAGEKEKQVQRGSFPSPSGPLKWEMKLEKMEVRSIPNSRKPRALAKVRIKEDNSHKQSFFGDLYWLEVRRPWQLKSSRRLQKQPLLWEEMAIRLGEARLTPLSLLYLPSNAFEPQEPITVPLPTR
ncbi:MAG: hypothetical protein KY468_08455 [Armatimonadetes bacterium]|nr:hypothetical protein [Armatimonadota bacterium]